VQKTRITIAAGAVLALIAASAAMAAPHKASSPLQERIPAQATKASQKQPVVRGFYEGKSVGYFDFGPIKLKAGNKLAPIWTFTNGAAGQRNVIDTVPGEKDYSPLWAVSKVTWAEGKTPRVLKSADEVKAAAKAGEVTIAKTSIVVNCPVLGFGQQRHAGFTAGHVTHYYDLGPVKVAPGNDVVLLYTVTNGVAAQKNITRDAIAPGQTAYPPLWAISKVTWKASATPRLLKSFVQIRRAQAAGDLTVTATSLVVNCPIV
jgi:hypothetical protein